MIQIKDLKPNLKNLNLQVIVLDISKPTQTKDGHEVRTVRVADRSGSVNFSVWNECGSIIREGDVLRLQNCFTQIWKQQLQLKLSSKGSIVKYSEFMLLFSELPDMSILPPDILKQIQEQQGGTSSTTGNNPVSNTKPSSNNSIGKNF